MLARMDLAGSARPAAKRLAPGPRGHLILGSLPDARRDPIGLFMNARANYGDLVRFRFGPITAHLVSSPAGANHVLAENNKNYGKNTRGFDQLRLILGNGLLTSQGDFWKRQRRLAQPAFHRNRIAGFAASMVRAAEQCSVRWAEEPGPIDVHAEMMRLTLQIVGETLLGFDPTSAAVEVSQALDFLLHLANDRMTRLFPLPIKLPTAEHRQLRASLAQLDKVVLRVIAERRAASGKASDESSDLISMLMQARDVDTGEAMTDAQLRDEAMTIFLAGHETTANALTWTFFLLSRHPSVEREVSAELQRELGGRSPTAADLPRLRYTKMVLEEAMRLYPPAWIISRSVIDDDEIDGCLIPAGSIIFASPYVIHRHPGVFENPEGFDPERFAPERLQALPKGAYFPFGGGPRQCIGNGFAIMEGQLLLATLLQKFRLDLVPGYLAQPVPSVTLRPKHGMPMNLHPR